MAVTIKAGPIYVGNKRMVEIEVDMTSYATGGEEIKPEDCGLAGIDMVHGGGMSDAGYVHRYNYGTAKVLAYAPTGAHSHTENTAASYTQNATTANSTADVADEAASTTDVGASRFLVFGY